MLAGSGEAEQGFLMGVRMKIFKRHLNRTTALAVVCLATLGWSSASVASIDLSGSDLSHIGAAVTKAINEAKAGMPAGSSHAEFDAAIAHAIASETKTLITEYHDANAMLIAEAVITAAVDDGAPPASIGKGLADAALAEGPTVGLEIADAVGSTAPRESVKIFEQTADASGTSLGTTLASAAESYTAIGAGSRGGNGTQMSFGNTSGANGAGTGGGAGCKHPSCT
jgi:hypothetical protein